MIRIQEAAQLGPEQELEILKHNLLDPQTGIINKLVSLPYKAIEADLFHYLTSSSQIFMTEVFGWEERFKGMGGSVDTGRIPAQLSAIGENVERYSSGFYDRSRFRKAAYKDLDVPATPPGDYALIHPEQPATIHPFDENRVTDWAEAWSLRDRCPRWVPAAMIYVPFVYDYDEEMIYQPVSTGLSVHPDQVKATVKSVNEVVERDAFTIFWLNALPREQLELPTGVPEIDAYVERYFARFGDRFGIVNITTDLDLPAFFCYVVGEYEKREPALAVGSAADPDPVQALLKALTEAFHTRSWGINMLVTTPADQRRCLPREEWDTITSFETHVEMYCHPDLLPELDFFLKPEKKVPFSSLFERKKYCFHDERARLKRLVDVLAAGGHDCVIADVTTPDIGGLGLSVMRAIVPGLHPLNSEHRNRYLGGARLYEVPPKLGYPRKTWQEMNPLPHPFP